MQETNFRDVLLVDDDEVLRDSVVACLSEAGVGVETVSNGAEALDRLRSASYAVLLLDEEMLGTVMEELRDHQPRSVVFVMSSSNDVRKLAIAGSAVQAILHKPLDISEVAPVIQGCVAQLRKVSAIPSPAGSRH